MSLRTVTDIFFNVVDRNLDRAMLYRQTVKWIPISSRELYRDVAGAARSLLDWGIAKGDRVAILSENRPEWAVTDFACACIGAVVVPVYPTLTAEQTAVLLRDSGARVAFTSTVQQLDKVLAIQPRTAIEKVVAMDYIGNPQGIPMHRLMQAGPNARDPEFDAMAHAIQPDDLATIIYTSGTTGTPKGVMLTHGNLASNLIYSLEDMGLGVGDCSISFLPLSHITARHVDYALLNRGVTIAYLSNHEKLPETMREIRPSFFVSVPRVYEKIRETVEKKAASGFARSVLNWALGVGEKHKQEILAGRTPASLDWKLADTLVFSKVRHALGGKVRMFISGGAPLGRELAEWFATVGIRICEGYGLTETSPVISLNTPKSYKLGTAGKPLPNVEVRIADDGEILTRGPAVFKGYWNLPEETKAAFDGDWFRTGDIGHLDADGFLVVTDRKKNLIKTSGGKFIAPQPLEAKLKDNPLIAEAVIVGDRHKFPAVVLLPEFEHLEAWAREHGVSAATRDQLIGDPKVRALYDGIIAEANKNLAQFEKIKRLLLIAEAFSIADGTLTPTMKLRRRAVEDRYKQQIEQLYRDAEKEATPIG